MNDVDKRALLEEMEQRRNDLGLSQENTAHEIGVTLATYNKFVREKRLPSNLSVQAIQAWLEKQKNPALSKSSKDRDLQKKQRRDV